MLTTDDNGSNITQKKNERKRGYMPTTVNQFSQISTPFILGNFAANRHSNIGKSFNDTSGVTNVLLLLK